MSQPINDAQIDLIVNTNPIAAIEVGEVTNQPVAFDVGEVPNLITNGLPVAGTTGQQLAKKSNNDYDTQWVTPHEVPAGGTAGQKLIKNTATDYDASWITKGDVPAGGTTGQALRKNSATDYDTSWQTPTVNKANSGEIALSGDGATTPLSAALTGTRVGGWVVAGGDLIVGDGSVGTARRLCLNWKDGANNVAWWFTPAGSNWLNVECYVNGAKVASPTFAFYGALNVYGATSLTKGIVINDGGAGTGDYWSQAIQNYRTINGKITAYILGHVDENTPLGVQLRTNGTDRGRLDFFVEPSTNKPSLVMQDLAGGVARPIPFATSAGQQQISLSAAASGTVAFTWPTGRFLQQPIVTVTTIGNGNYYSYIPSGTTSNTGCSAAICHRDGATATITQYLNIMAVQMTPTSSQAGPPAREAEPLEEGVVEWAVTCHTEDCHNGEETIVIRALSETVDFFCGPCGQRITDVAAP